MLSLNAINVIEGIDCLDERDYFAAVQEAINEGSWSLQGSYGRTMMDAIQSGRCMLGKFGANDYWGNYIPSRDEVKEGTKGSREFVVEVMGEEWADYLAEV